MASPVIGAMPRSAQSVIRVLLVEDEPKLRKSLVEGLQLEEWHVMGAASSAEAWHHLDTEVFDLIVLDWMLPDGDGLEIVRRLRTQGNSVPVLMITARAGASAAVQAKQSGATDYLAKPFSFDDLLSRCRALLTGAS
ncbi:MAG: response regulator [Opitutaceae bacterium]|nr:response regulator [Opitutaceae bacterium]